MSAFVVELRFAGRVQIVREPIDAAERLCVLLGVLPMGDEPVWHAARRALAEHGENATIVLHALDAALERSTAFLDIDVAGDPEPFHRVLRGLRSIETSGLPAMMAYRGLIEGVKKDVEEWEALGIDPVLRAKFLVREFALDRHPALKDCCTKITAATHALQIWTAFFETKAHFEAMRDRNRFQPA